MQAFQQQLEAIYSQSLESKKRWYSKVATAYDQARPRYPKQILDQVVTITQLSPGARVLEIGCGPGIATTALAELGFAVVGLEPSPEASQLAQHKCQAYPQIQILNTTFEEWDLEPEAFDVVFATTSFHWLSPETACQKAAAALRDEGFLVLFWNTPTQPNKDVYRTLQRQQLFTALGETLEANFPQDLPTHYLSAFHLAQKQIKQRR
jgi:SAM-dependent methyltransferase